MHDSSVDGDLCTLMWHALENHGGYPPDPCKSSYVPTATLSSGLISLSKCSIEACQTSDAPWRVRDYHHPSTNNTFNSQVNLDRSQWTAFNVEMYGLWAYIATRLWCLRDNSSALFSSIEVARQPKHICVAALDSEKILFSAPCLSPAPNFIIPWVHLALPIFLFKSTIYRTAKLEIRLHYDHCFPLKSFLFGNVDVKTPNYSSSFFFEIVSQITLLMHWTCEHMQVFFPIMEIVADLLQL